MTRSNKPHSTQPSVTTTHSSNTRPNNTHSKNSGYGNDRPEFGVYAASGRSEERLLHQSKYHALLDHHDQRPEEELVDLAQLLWGNSADNARSTSNSKSRRSLASVIEVEDSEDTEE